MASAWFTLIYWLALQCAWAVRCQEEDHDDQPVEIPPTKAIEELGGTLTSPPTVSTPDVFENACVSDIEACGSVAGLLKSCVAEEDQLACRCQAKITSLEHSCHFVDAKICQGTAFNPATIRTEVMFYGQCEGGAEAWAEAVGTVSFDVLFGHERWRSGQHTARMQIADYGMWESNHLFSSYLIKQELAEAEATTTGGHHSEATAEGSESGVEEHGEASTSARLSVSIVALLFSVAFALSL